MTHIPKIISLIFLAWSRKTAQGEKSITSYPVKKRTVPWIHLGWICTTGSQPAATAQVHCLLPWHDPGKEHFSCIECHCYLYFFFVSLYSFFNSHSNGLSEGWSSRPAVAANCSSIWHKEQPQTKPPMAADGRGSEEATQAEKQSLGDLETC